MKGMHELAICQALMEQVDRIALEQQAACVAAVHLQIGPLSGVEPALLEQAFYVAAAGGVAAGARLVITSMPVSVSCDSCGKISEVMPSRLVCAHCGDWHTRLVSGDELFLNRIEIDREKENSDASPAAETKCGQLG